MLFTPNYYSTVLYTYGVVLVVCSVKRTYIFSVPPPNTCIQTCRVGRLSASLPFRYHYPYRVTELRVIRKRGGAGLQTAASRLDCSNIHVSTNESMTLYHKQGALSKLFAPPRRPIFYFLLKLLFYAALKQYLSWPH
jgi:hypothetical protein